MAASTSALPTRPLSVESTRTLATLLSILGPSALFSIRSGESEGAWGRPTASALPLSEAATRLIEASTPYLAANINTAAGVNEEGTNLDASVHSVGAGTSSSVELGNCRQLDALFQGVSAEARELLIDMLALDPARRPSAQNALDHK